jgi:RNA polymerase sigma-70 factor (ECF subfamily)
LRAEAEAMAAMASDEIGAVFRREAGQVLATLIRLLGDFDLAEESLQEAFEVALKRWARDGAPAHPQAWLIRTARNRAIDQLRRRASFQRKRPALGAEAVLAAIPDTTPDDDNDDSDWGPLADDVLRLIFTCCHPALAMEARVALTLRTVCGLTTGEVARGFLVAEETMAQRLVRAKAKIRGAGIPYRVPPLEMLDERLEGVLATLYLVFTEGYAATPDDDAARRGLTIEAIRLARLVDGLMPGAAIKGLLALMLLQDARRAARATPAGEIVLLEDQDRGLWDTAQIEEGLPLVEVALRTPGPPSAYAVQAAIGALHARAASHAQTDWPQIAGLYAVLAHIHPSPVIELNRAVAVSMVDGPARALDIVDALIARGELAGYHLAPAVRADFLRRLGRRGEAVAAYRQALALARLEPERRLLARRIAELG